MSKIKFKEIADAIREKDGTTETIVANDFASRIRALPSGKYNLEVTDEDDGTQSWNLTDWDYVPTDEPSTPDEPVVPEEPAFDPIFENNSWAQIAEASQIIKENDYSSAQVKEIFGWDLLTDTKVDIGTDGVSRTIHFNGFNHDELSDGSGFAGITFGMVDLEPTLYRMNEESTNAGGYPAMSMRNYTLPAIKELLSVELQSVIKKVNKKSGNGGRDNYTETITTEEELFLYARGEIGQSDPVESTLRGEPEGRQYEYWWNKTATDRIKMYDADGDGIPETAKTWLFRTCFTGSRANYFWGVKASDGNYMEYSATTERGVLYAFCI